MAFRFGGAITTSGLVLHLDAANPYSYPGSGTTWFDLSPFKNDLTLAGATLPAFSTNHNGSFVFNGSTSYAVINTNTSLQITTPTVIVACSIGSGVVLSRGRAGSYFNYGISTPTTTAFSSVQTSCPNTISGLPATTQPMNLYGAVYTGASVDFYRNGSYVGNSATCYSPNTGPLGTLSVGAALSSDGVNYQDFYAGTVGIVLVYNRILTSDEMIQTQNSLKARYNQY